jgi:hypothetical protein
MYKRTGMFGLLGEIHTVIEAEARDAIAAGWAEVRIDEGAIGPTLHLEPMKLRAAPLEVYLDSDQLVVCYPGRNSMVVEFFSEDRVEISDGVRALAAAVVAGSYGERLKRGTTDVEARWPGPHGPQRARRSVISVPGTGDNPWREVDYEPY